MLQSQLINQGIKEHLGGLNSAKLSLVSVNFAEIERFQHLGEWEEAAKILSKAAQSLELSGADFFLICTNIMHKVAEQVQAAVNIPMLHIADGTAEQLIQDSVSKVGLLGTRFTMEQDFYKGRLIKKYGIDVITPHADEQEIIHRVIYEELCLGKISAASRDEYLEVVNSLHQRSTQAVILGCTEIALLIQQTHTSVPLYNTTEIHAIKAVEYALNDAN